MFLGFQLVTRNSQLVTRALKHHEKDIIMWFILALLIFLMPITDLDIFRLGDIVSRIIKNWQLAFMG